YSLFPIPYSLFPALRQKRLQKPGARLMAEAGESALLDLADARAGDAEALADLLEGEGFGFAAAEVEAEDLGFALAEGAQRVFDGAGEGLGVEFFVGAGGEVVADVVEELAFFAGNEGGIEGEVGLGHGQRVFDLFLG